MNRPERLRVRELITRRQTGLSGRGRSRHGAGREPRRLLPQAAPMSSELRRGRRSRRPCACLRPPWRAGRSC